MSAEPDVRSDATEVGGGADRGERDAAAPIATTLTPICSSMPPGASYAVYLCPRLPDLKRTLLNPASALAKALMRTMQNPNWGGQIHVTLCSFAGTADRPARNRRSQHQLTLAQLHAAAKTAAQAGTDLYPGNRFRVTPDKWSVRMWSGLCLFDVSKRSRTLGAILQALRGCKKPRKVRQLHVTLDAAAGRCKMEVLHFLSECSWDVCVVGIPDDNETGTGLKTLSRFPVGRISIHS